MFDVHVPLPVSLRSPYVHRGTHSKEQGSGKSLGGRTVWYGYWYGIGMHSETDWKCSEK